MGKNDVNVVLAGDSGDAQRAWLDMIGVMQQMEKQLQKMSGQIGRTADRTTRSLEKSNDMARRFVNSIKSFGTAYYALNVVRSGLRMINQEMEASLALGKKQLAPRLSYQSQLATMLRNVGPEEFHSALAVLQGYSGPIDRSALIQAGTYAVTTAGLKTSRTEAIRAARQTAEFYPELWSNPETLKFATAAAMQLYESSPQFQVSDASGRPTYNKALGFLNAAQRVSMQPSIEEFSRYTAMSLKQLVTTFGYSPRAAMAMLAATQTEAGDIRGRMGSTAALIQAAQLADVAAKFGRSDLKGEGIENWLRTGTGREVEQARQYMFGLIRGEAGKMAAEVGAGASMADIAGRQQGAARYKSVMENYIMGRGLVWQGYQKAFGDLSPEAILKTTEGVARILRGSPEFDVWREEGRARAVEGEMAEVTTHKARHAAFMKTVHALSAAAGYGEGSWSRYLREFDVDQYSRWREFSATPAGRAAVLRRYTRKLINDLEPGPMWETDEEFWQRMDQGDFRRPETRQLLGIYRRQAGMSADEPQAVRIVDDAVRANEPAAAATGTPAEALSE